MGENLAEILGKLQRLDDVSWGNYLFSRDSLCGRIAPEEKKRLIKLALVCGEDRAHRIKKRLGSINAEQLAEYLKLDVEYMEWEQGRDRILFALFTPPTGIQIMLEPLQRAGKQQELLSWISGEEMKNLILGHEIYHYLEEQEPALYTRAARVELWRFLGYRRRVPVRALSEIGAMAFTKQLQGGDFPPCALDVAMYYSYSPEKARGLCTEILQAVSDSGTG